MALSQDETARYARHIVLNAIGGSGQQKMKSASVLVVGAGGLGSPILLYLAAAGIGRIGIVDDDVVSLSNLQRQVIHGESDIGRLKTDSASAAIGRLNHHIVVETHATRILADNAADLVSRYDIVIDGSDNFATRYLMADTAEALGKPLVTAAIQGFDGSITTLCPHLVDADGRPNPRYRDVFPAPPADGVVPSCALAGVIGALPGVLGSLAAMEAIKLITGVGEPLIGRLLLVETAAMRFETVRYRRKAG